MDEQYGILFESPDVGTLLVYPRCHCGRFLKHGHVLINGLDEVKLVEWTCNRHGEVRPNYEFVDPEDLVKA